MDRISQPEVIKDGGQTSRPCCYLILILILIFPPSRRAWCWLSVRPSGWVSLAERFLTTSNEDDDAVLIKSHLPQPAFVLFTVEELWTCSLILHPASLVIYLVSHNFSPLIFFFFFIPLWILNCDIKRALFAGTVCRTSRLSGLSFLRLNHLQIFKMSFVPCVCVCMWSVRFAFQGCNT